MMHSINFLISLIFFLLPSDTTFVRAYNDRNFLNVNLDEDQYHQKGVELEIKALPFFFEQSFVIPIPRNYDFAARNFGLVSWGRDESNNGDDDETINASWEVFKKKINDLNSHAEKGVSYKVLYLARHGEGGHNAAEEWYGPEAWECYWAMQAGNETHTWAPDSKLTEKGISQVRYTNLAWKRQISLGAPLPEAHYVSPLSRALSTMMITWEDIALNPPIPIVKELLRETLSLHLGDKRSPKSKIQSTFPIAFDDLSFPDHDELWTYHRESIALRDLRIKTVLTEILTAENSKNTTYIAITSHLGTIKSALRVLGHQEWPVNTAGMIPVVVEIKEKEVYGGGGGKELSYWDVVGRIGKKQPEWRSVCEGYPEVLVAGGYVVPGGVGIDDILYQERA